MMKSNVYKPEIGWWVPAVVIFTICVCLIVPIFTQDWLLGIILATILVGIEIIVFASVKYKITGDSLGIRNLFYKWEWFPINKITEIKQVDSCLSSSALSFHRLAIRFSDKNILKSSMPLEIAPANKYAFTSRLKEINPAIIVK